MKNNSFIRSINLIGNEKFEVINKVKILLVGLGGVGGTVFEALVRTGFEHFIIVDGDIVDSSNLNRQILFCQNDVGNDKVIVAKKHALHINPDLDILTIKATITEQNLDFFNEMSFDFLIDAIDDVPAKVALVKFAINHEIPFVSSLGMANRFDPSKVIITRLDKATGDPLAKKFRYELKQIGIDTKKVNVCHSSETPIKDGANLNSIMMPPSSAGLNIAYHVLSHFIK
ncbi:MAG TPA: ThiF family adenylyltransferase [Bacilli bacterium]|nr:ThiF family adenylyltransferase [Bacilli bacterium]